MTQFEKASLGNWLQNMLMSQFNGQGKQSSASQTPAQLDRSNEDTQTSEDQSAANRSAANQNAEEKNTPVKKSDESSDGDKIKSDSTEQDVIRDELFFRFGIPGFDQRDRPLDTYLTSETADLSIWTRGVMRYHRAKILEKLGRSEEAKADWDWLKEQNLPPDDRLH